MYYISAYFSTLPDRHREVTVQPDDFDYIKEYYNSIKKHDLECRILVDKISDWFIEKYQTEKIKFVKVCIEESEKEMHPHDLRFIKIKEFIEENGELSHEAPNRQALSYIALTDIRDVVVLNDCYPLLASNRDKLFLAQEGGEIYQSEWFIHYLEYIKEDLNMDFSNYKLFKGKTILNCGIICGSKKVLLDFLRKFTTYLEIMKVTKKPLDMFIVNLLAYRDFKQELSLNSSLNTPFGQDESDQSKYFKHK